MWRGLIVSLCFSENSLSPILSKIMQDPKLPLLLINEVGGTLGVLEAHVPFLKKHFQLITMKEFLESKECYRAQVQAIYSWWHKPVIDRELLKSLPNLKVISSAGVGTDHLDLKLISGFGVRIANTPHAVHSTTADIGMALLLAAARRLVEGNTAHFFTVTLVSFSRAVRGSRAEYLSRFDSLWKEVN